LYPDQITLREQECIDLLVFLLDFTGCTFGKTATMTVNMIKIYHYQQCSKSCAALDFLQKNAQEMQVQEYLHDTPSKAELKEILAMLGMKPLELIRKNESLFRERFQHLQLTDDEWIEVMVNNPVLIERPIVIKDGKAVIGRPLEKVVELLRDW